MIPSLVRNHLEMILTIPQTITAVTRKSKTAMMTSFSFCPQQLLHCSLPTAEGILAPQHSYYTPAFLDSTCVRSRVRNSTLNPLILIVLVNILLILIVHFACSRRQGKHDHGVSARVATCFTRVEQALPLILRQESDSSSESMRHLGPRHG